MRAEYEEMLPLAKEPKKPEKAGAGDPVESLLKDRGPTILLEFGLIASRTVRE